MENEKLKGDKMLIGAGIGAVSFTTATYLFYKYAVKSKMPKEVVLISVLSGIISGFIVGFAIESKNSPKPSEKKASATGLRESPTKSTRGLFTTKEDQENKKVEIPISTFDRWKIKLGVMNAKQMHDIGTGKKY